MNFEKTDLINDILYITNDDHSITCIPEEGSTLEEQSMFEEFRAKYPDGKPQPEVPITDPIPTTDEKLTATQQELIETQNRLTEARASIVNLSSDFQLFMELTFSRLPD